MKFTYSLILLGALLFLSSFSAVPIKKRPATSSKKQQQWERRQQQLKKRLHFLQIKSKQPRKQQHLQKKLKRRQQQQKNKDSSSFMLGLLSLIGGGISGVLWVAAVANSFALAFNPAGFAIVGVILAFCILFALTGLLLGILHLNKRSQNPEDYDKPGFAIAGIIISSVFLLLSIVLIVGAFLP